MVALQPTAESAGAFVTDLFLFPSAPARAEFAQCIQGRGFSDCFVTPMDVNTSRVGGSGRGLVLGVALGLGVAWAVRMMGPAVSY